MNKIDVFKELVRLKEEGDKWVKSLPREINTAFFDNPYVDSLESTINLLMKAAFSLDEQDDVEWFMDEWMSSVRSKELCWVIDGNEYHFSGIDDYIEFLKVHRGWWLYTENK